MTTWISSSIQPKPDAGATSTASATAVPTKAATIPTTIVNQSAMRCLPGAINRPNAPITKPTTSALIKPPMVIGPPKYCQPDAPLSHPTPHTSGWALLYKSAYPERSGSPGSERRFGDVHEFVVGGLDDRAPCRKLGQYRLREERRDRHLALVERLVLGAGARVQRGTGDLRLLQQLPTDQQVACRHQQAHAVLTDLVDVGRVLLRRRQLADHRAEHALHIIQCLLELAP